MYLGYVSRRKRVCGCRWARPSRDTNRRFMSLCGDAMAEKAAEFREKGGEIYLSEDGTVREPID